MKIIKTVTAAMIAALCVISFMSCKSTVEIENVAPRKFAKEISTGKIRLLDVRTAEEYAESHIKDAHNIDVQSSAFMKDAERWLEKNRTVYVYCRSGRRSMTAARMLSAEGYSVINLDGGILAWQAAGLPVVR